MKWACFIIHGFAIRVEYPAPSEEIAVRRREKARFTSRLGLGEMFRGGEREEGRVEVEKD